LLGQGQRLLGNGREVGGAAARWRPSHLRGGPPPPPPGRPPTHTPYPTRHPPSDGKLYPFLAKPKDDLRKDYRLMDFAGGAGEPGEGGHGLAAMRLAI
jgi:hypothetical protein